MELFNCFLSTLTNIPLKVRSWHSELYIKTFLIFEKKLVEPERVENTRDSCRARMKEFSHVMEKEQEHRHRLQKTQMETWSRLVILKMWILTICSAGVFSIGLL